MIASTAISQQIVEELYAEALLLADEARTAFDLSDGQDPALEFNEARIAMSIEGLRTTTRVMNSLAWLLNQRAYFSGELTHEQLKKHCTLSEERPSDPRNMAKLPLKVRSLIRDTERLHGRVARLDREQRSRDAANDDPVGSLQGRIADAFGAG
jgi:regulator of CtrA degradation